LVEPFGEGALEFGSSQRAVLVCVRRGEEPRANETSRVKATATRAAFAPGLRWGQHFPKPLGKLFLGDFAGLICVELIKPRISQGGQFSLRELLVAILVALRDHLPGEHHARPETAAAAHLSASATGAALGWHCAFIVDLSDGDDQLAFPAIAGLNHRAVFAALEDAFEAVQAQAATRTAGIAVAPKARRLKQWANILFVSNAFLRGRGWKLAQVGGRLGR
jgi:hypothetical protein